MNRTSGKTYTFEDYKGWTIAAARQNPGAWHGFARPPGDPYGPFTLTTRTTGPLPSRESALEAMRYAIDEEGY